MRARTKWPEPNPPKDTERPGDLARCRLTGLCFWSMTRIAKPVRGVLRLARGFVREPREAASIPRWLMSLTRSRSPLSMEIPWLPFAVTAYLDDNLDRRSRVFEYGGGGSTLWLARRVQSVTTVEHDPRWHGVLSAELRRQGLENCTVLLREAVPAEPASAGAEITFGSAVSSGSFEEYARTIDRLPDGSLDLVLVDGRSRAACVLCAKAKLREGGLLVLDDSNRARYRSCMQALAGWRRRDFYGLKPSFLYPGTTTVWVAPRVS